MLVIVGLYDTGVNVFEGIYTYENQAVALTKLRRSVRDAYLNHEVSNDWINEHSFVIVGTLLNDPDHEKVVDGTACSIYGYRSADWIYYNCYDFVDGIYQAGEEDDA